MAYGISGSGSLLGAYAPTLLQASKQTLSPKSSGSGVYYYDFQPVLSGFSDGIPFLQVASGGQWFGYTFDFSESGSPLVVASNAASLVLAIMRPANLVPASGYGAEIRNEDNVRVWHSQAPVAHVVDGISIPDNSSFTASLNGSAISAGLSRMQIEGSPGANTRVFGYRYTRQSLDVYNVAWGRVSRGTSTSGTGFMINPTAMAMSARVS